MLALWFARVQWTILFRHAVDSLHLFVADVDVIGIVTAVQQKETQVILMMMLVDAMIVL